jgi:hypothetical protein
MSNLYHLDSIYKLSLEGQCLSKIMLKTELQGATRLTYRAISSPVVTIDINTIVTPQRGQILIE